MGELNGQTHAHKHTHNARQVSRAWLKAALHGLLTRSSSPAVRLEECRVFYGHLRKRGESYPASARPTGASDTACWRRGPRPSTTTRCFANIAGAPSPTETHRQQKSFREASAPPSSHCARLGKAPGGPSSRQKPSSQSGALCRRHPFSRR